MKRKKIIIIGIIVLLVVVIITLFMVKQLKTTEQIVSEADDIGYDNNETETTRALNILNRQILVEDTRIQGIVQLKYNGEITITECQHFGELGYPIEEYSFAVIKDKNQVCVDYFTSEKYDTSYVETGDILICIGNLIKNTTRGDDFDTKENSIIVLKSSDYNKMKEESLNKQRDTKITLGDLYMDDQEQQYLFLKYDIVDSTLTDTYHFPFIQKSYITDTTNISGNLEKGKPVKIQFTDLNSDSDGLVLKSIKVVEE